MTAIFALTIFLIGFVLGWLFFGVGTILKDYFTR